MTQRPAYSPAAPELGWREHAWKPVILQRSDSSSYSTVSANLSAPVSNTYRDNLGISLYLIQGGERMDGAKFQPCQWDHTARAVKLHRATYEIGNGMNHRQFFGLKMDVVTYHLSIRIMCV